MLSLSDSLLDCDAFSRWLPILAAPSLALVVGHCILLIGPTYGLSPHHVSHLSIAAYWANVDWTHAVNSLRISAHRDQSFRLNMTARFGRPHPACPWRRPRNHSVS